MTNTLASMPPDFSGELPIDPVDVIIVGGGLAGHCAAWEAAGQGCGVLMLEKGQKFGGSSSAGPGVFVFAGTDDQEAQGIRDSNEQLLADLVRAGGGKAKVELVEKYVALQLDTYRWLRELGFKFDAVVQSSYSSVPRSHPLKAALVVEQLHRRLLQLENFAYLCATPVRRLTASNTRINGVQAEHEGRILRVSARKAVVLTTGGFARSDRLLEKFAPAYVKAVRAGGIHNEGDGLTMACEHGADVLDAGYITGTFGAACEELRAKAGLNEPDVAYLLEPWYKGGIVVNRKGLRYVNEEISYKLIGAKCLEQEDPMSFAIFDQSMMDRSQPIVGRDLKGYFELGLIHSAPDLDALANLAGIDAANLNATVERYNGFVTSGVDADFGRRHLIGSSGQLSRIDQPPYYAYPTTTAMLSTFAGLAVNSDMQVLDVFDRKIEGLYAAGEVIGGFHGKVYMSGTSLGKSAIFGRLAGANAAKLAARA
jgi:fumarate reductase flavoprotein subunit